MNAPPRNAGLRPGAGDARRRPDVIRSAAGCAAAEAIWLPAALLPLSMVFDRWGDP